MPHLRLGRHRAASSVTYGRPIWDPAQYNRYGGQRIRAALELLGRVEHPGPRRFLVARR
jgi:hypothetical protein